MTQVTTPSAPVRGFLLDGKWLSEREPLEIHAPHDGSVVGAGAGTAIQVFTKGEQVRVPSETVLDFNLEKELVIRQAATRPRQ